MAFRADFHLHSLFSDGKNSPEEVVLAAIGKGMTAIGFSDHSWTPFDESYCMKRERISDYMLEIARLKRKYRGRIKIFCGIEQDYFAGLPAGGFDYVIGSVHYVKVRGEYLPVDHDIGVLREGIDRRITSAPAGPSSSPIPTPRPGSRCPFRKSRGSSRATPEMSS